ncbi:MAG: DsbA family protein [Halobacteriales archaeon]
MPTRRRVLVAAGAAGLGGCLGGGGSGAPPDGPVANAPIPETPGAHRYATAGTGSAPVVTYVGSWKCPYCAEFSLGFLRDIVEEYVEPGALSLRYRALAYASDGGPFLGPDAPRAARAGLAVWNVDPDTYWRFHEHVMANQPPEGRRWATTDRLVGFAEEAGVEGTDRIRAAVEGGRYRAAVRATARMTFEAGVEGTPALLIDGEVVSPFEKERTRRLLDRVAGA